MKKVLLFISTLFISIFLYGCYASGSVSEQFEYKFDRFKSKLALSDHLVLDINIELEMLDGTESISDSKIESTMKMCSDPLYADIEMKTDKIKERYVLTQEDNSIYQYKIISEDTIISEYYSSIDDYENSEYETVFGFEYNEETVTLVKEDDYYIFTQQYTDALTEADKEYLENLYNTLGLDLNDILESELVTKFKFEKNSLYMSFDLNADLNMPSISAYYEDLKIKSSIEYNLVIEEFEPINFDDYGVIYRDFENIRDYAILNKTYNLNKVATSIFKFRLEKGYYLLDRSNYHETIDMEFQDSNGNIIKMNKLFNYVDISSSAGCIFEVKEEGDYYLRVNQYPGKVTLKEFDINKYFEVSEISKKIECDLKKEESIYLELTTVSPLICIENNSEYTIAIENVTAKTTEFIRPNTKEFFAPRLGKNCIILSNKVADGKCNVTITSIESDGNPTTKFEDLELITESPSNGFYIHGPLLSKPNLKLVVEEQGYYTFFNKTDKKSSKMSFTIEKVNGSIVDSSGENKYLLSPGEYRVVISTSSLNEYAYGNVYYKFETYPE